MPDRYFRNAGTSWNDTNNWSASSGGAGGASIPTTADKAIFDVNSGNCNIDVNAICNKLEMLSTYTNTITQNAGFTLSCTSSSFAIQCDGGAFVGGNSLIDCDGPVRINGGSFTSTSGILDIQARNNNDFQLISGVFIHNSGEILISGSNHHQITTDASNPLYKLTINTCPTCIHSGTYYIVNDLNFILCQNINATIFARGNVLGAGYAGGNGVLTIDGTGVQNYSLIGVSSLTINKSSGTLEIQNNIEVGGTNWTYTAGTINWNGYGITFVGVPTHVTISGGTFNDVIVNKGATNTVSMGGSTIVVNGNLTLTALSNLNSGTIQLYGNLVSNDTVMTGSATIEIKGSANQTYTGAASAVVGANIIVNKTGGSFTLNSDFTQDGTGNDFTLTAGSINIGAYTISVKDVFTQNGGTFNGSSGKLVSKSVILNTGVFNEGLLGINFTGALFQIAIGMTFNRHANGIISTDGNSTQTAEIDLNGNEITALYHNRGAWDLDVTTDVIVNGDYTFKGTSTSAAQIGSGVIYFKGDQYIVDGQSGSGSNAMVYINGLGNQKVHWKQSDNNRSSTGLTVDKSTGTLSFLSDNNDCSIATSLIVLSNSANISIPNNYRIRFIDNFIHSILESNGLSLPSLKISKGNFDFTINDDAEIQRDIEVNVGGSGSQIIGSYNFKVGRNFTKTGVNSTVSLANAPTWILNGSGDQKVNCENNMPSGIYHIVKSSGVVIQESNVSIDNGSIPDNGNNDMFITGGVWCTNEFNLTVDGEIEIGTLGLLRKTPASTVTYNSIVGSVTDVDKCFQSRSAFFLTTLHKDTESYDSGVNT